MIKNKTRVESVQLGKILVYAQPIKWSKNYWINSNLIPFKKEKNDYPVNKITILSMIQDQG